MPDDDLMTGWRDINRLFEICYRHSLMLAQPSLGANSFISHALTRQDERYWLRFSKFVEIMCPLFSREALRICIETFKGMNSGWGLDHMWLRLLGDIASRIAIIDEVAVLHGRPIGQNYNRAEALEEAKRLLQLYGAEDRAGSGFLNRAISGISA
jgi:hypothetical protein